MLHAEKNNADGKKGETEITENLVVENDTEDEAAEKEDEAEDEAEDEPSNRINKDKLKEIEEADTFEVKITKKELVKDAFSGISLEGNDACVFSIENGTDADITDVEIYTVAYTEKDGLVKLSQGAYIIGNHPYVQLIAPEEDTVVAAGETFEMAVKCNTSKFAGVRAIVASYVDAQGVKHENASAEEWFKSYELGKITELD